MILPGYIGAPCSVCYSLSIDKFTSDKSHEHNCPTFRRSAQDPSVQAPGSSGALGTDSC